MPLKVEDVRKVTSGSSGDYGRTTPSLRLVSGPRQDLRHHSARRRAATHLLAGRDERTRLGDGSRVPGAGPLGRQDRRSPSTSSQGRESNGASTREAGVRTQVIPSGEPQEGVCGQAQAGTQECGLTLRSSGDLHRHGTWPAKRSLSSSASRAKRHPGSGPSAQTLGVTRTMCLEVSVALSPLRKVRRRRRASDEYLKWTARCQEEEQPRQLPAVLARWLLLLRQRLANDASFEADLHGVSIAARRLLRS